MPWPEHPGADRHREATGRRSSSRQKSAGATPTTRLKCLLHHAGAQAARPRYPLPRGSTVMRKPATQLPDGQSTHGR